MDLEDLLFDLAIIATVVVGGVFGVGYFLPPNHISKTRATINKRPDQVFEMLADFAKWPRWNKEAKNAQRRPDQNGHPVWLLGEHLLEILEIVPPVNGMARLVTRIADPKSPFQGTWTWLIEPTGGAATLTIIEEGTIKSPVWRFLAKYLFGHHATAKTLMHTMGQYAEQTVTPEEIP